MSSVKIARMEVPGANWSVMGVFIASMGKRQIADVLRIKFKRELSKRGLEEDDFNLIDFDRFSEYIEINTVKLGTAKILELYDNF